MPSVFIKSLVFTILAFLLSPLATAKYAEHPRLGINVGDLGKLTSSIPFTDIFKSSRGWLTSCEFDWGSGQAIDPECTRQNASNTREQDKLQLDGNGWPRRLPAPEESPIYTSVTSLWNLPTHFPTGRYVVIYEGTGTIKLSGDIRMGAQRPGHIEFDLLSPKRNLRLQITRTDPYNNGDYIRNLSVVPKARENDYQRYVFNPDYLERVRPLHSIRFMPWTNPRSNEVVEWNDRIKIGSAHYSSGKGVPAERMVDLANAIDAAPWLSVPYMASDDYIRQYARMVKKRMRKNQKVYVEYSNEVWNLIFPASTYAARKADKLWNFPYKDVEPRKRRVLLASNFYAKRSVEMCNIWKQEFGAERNRVKCVMGSLTTVPWIGEEILDCPLWKEANGCGRHIDAYGVGPYFGEYIARKDYRDTVKKWTRDSDGGLARLFSEIMEGGVLRGGPKGGAMTRVRDTIYANKKLADKYGLELLAYEAGQHLIRYDPPHTIEDPKVLNLFMSAQKDPRMKLAYEKYLKVWAEMSGGLMLHFYGIGEPEPKNFFGMLDHLDQPSTPKYAALMEYLGSHYAYTPPAPRTVAPVAIRPVAEAAPQVVTQQEPGILASPDGRVGAGVPILPMPGEEAVSMPEPVATPRAMTQAPSQPNPLPIPVATGFSGPGISGWTAPSINAVISPPIKLQAGADHQLKVFWRYENPRQNVGEYLRIFAIDNRGGQKLLFEQPDGDIAMMGNVEQLYEEDINRYIGPPIRIMLEASPGLKVSVSEVSF